MADPNNALPDNVKTKLHARTIGAHGSIMAEAKQNVLSSNNIVRHSAARQLDEPSPAQARSIDKILRLPGK